MYLNKTISIATCTENTSFLKGGMSEINRKHFCVSWDLFCVFRGDIWIYVKAKYFTFESTGTFNKLHTLKLHLPHFCNNSSNEEIHFSYPFNIFLFRRVFLITLRTLGISFISLLCRNARKSHFIRLWSKKGQTEHLLISNIWIGHFSVWNFSFYALVHSIEHLVLYFTSGPWILFAANRAW